MRINTQTLNDWIARNSPHGKEALAFKSGIGFWTLDRILRGVRLATKPELLSLISVTGLSEDQILAK
jgi:hypothetical protein